MNYRYRKQGHSYTHELFTPYDPTEDALWEQAALDFHYNHDGFEHNWPIAFEIFNVDGESLGTKEVSLDTEPVFNCCN